MQYSTFSSRLSFSNSVRDTRNLVEKPGRKGKKGTSRRLTNCVCLYYEKAVQGLWLPFGRILPVEISTQMAVHGKGLIVRVASKARTHNVHLLCLLIAITSLWIITAPLLRLPHFLYFSISYHAFTCLDDSLNIIKIGCWSWLTNRDFCFFFSCAVFFCFQHTLGFSSFLFG